MDTQSRISRIIHIPLSINDIVFSNKNQKNKIKKNSKTRKKIRVVSNSGKK
jgi:hypothetical protein